MLLYITLGGLTSAIYNEVLQFFLIVFGFAPLVVLGLIDVGGWDGLQAALAKTATAQGYAADAWSRTWVHMDSPQSNPMGVEWFGLSMGLGFVLAFGYWCTDFLIVQRAMAAESMLAARRIPVIAAVPKLLFPFLVILPGMIAIAMTYAHSGSGFELPKNASGGYTYDLAMPMLVLHYFPTGLLGLGITALLASFMSGMAGNVTAFNTVGPTTSPAYLHRGASDAHYYRSVALRRGGVRSRSGRVRATRSTTSWTSCSWCSPSSTPRCSPRSCSACSGSGQPATARSSGC